MRQLNPNAPQPKDAAMNPNQTPIPMTVEPLGNGSALAEVVHPDGTVWFWVLGDPNATTGTPDAPHDQLGRLPEEYRRRLGLECGAPTISGRPCTRLVRAYGERCTQHHHEPTGQGVLFDE